MCLVTCRVLAAIRLATCKSHSRMVELGPATSWTSDYCFVAFVLTSGRGFVDISSVADDVEDLTGSASTSDFILARSSRSFSVALGVIMGSSRRTTKPVYLA